MIWCAEKVQTNLTKDWVGRSLKSISRKQISDMINNICYFSLKIAFKWLVRAFSGYLSSDQVLLLWDRILAYNSLEILPGECVNVYSNGKDIVL